LFNGLALNYEPSDLPVAVLGAAPETNRQLQAIHEELQTLSRTMSAHEETRRQVALAQEETRRQVALAQEETRRQVALAQEETRRMQMQGICSSLTFCKVKNNLITYKTQLTRLVMPFLDGTTGLMRSLTSRNYLKTFGLDSQQLGLSHSFHELFPKELYRKQKVLLEKDQKQKMQ
jgi:hypothetical protein